jgi:hypothetical protein
VFFFAISPPHHGLLHLHPDPRVKHHMMMHIPHARCSDLTIHLIFLLGYYSPDPHLIFCTIYVYSVF